MGRDNLLAREKINFIRDFKNIEINNFTEILKGDYIFVRREEFFIHI